MGSIYVSKYRILVNNKKSENPITDHPDLGTSLCQAIYFLKIDGPEIIPGIHFLKIDGPGIIPGNILSEDRWS